ncbi:hypothetical protein [Streptomyces sp. NPDC088196]|uniref:hypothetical protein n=1 Tax=Streptomyces sp. NPDC088196 TaxID=3154868 RepID=UPI00345027FD
MAGPIRIDLERNDVPDPVVVDGGVDRVSRGMGNAMEVAQNRLLDLLARGDRDRHSADRRTAGAGTVHGYAYLER